MKLLRLDLSKRNYVEDFEIFETESNDLWEFAELLYEQEIEYINDWGHDDSERMEREDEIDYSVYETYIHNRTVNCTVFDKEVEMTSYFINFGRENEREYLNRL